MTIVFVFLPLTLPAADFCKAEANKILSGVEQDNLTQIGELARKVFPIEKNNSRLNAREEIYLLNNPSALLPVKNAACRSWALSEALCGFHDDNNQLFNDDSLDEETDAIRHFLFSAFITCSKGPKFAKEYTTIHEGPLETWDDANRMDFQNNMTAINWASFESRRCLTSMGDKEILRGALDQLALGKLVTIKKGKTRCADPKKISDKFLEELTPVINKAMRRMPHNC